MKEFLFLLPPTILSPNSKGFMIAGKIFNNLLDITNLFFHLGSDTLGQRKITMRTSWKLHIYIYRTPIFRKISFSLENESCHQVGSHMKNASP